MNKSGRMAEEFAVRMLLDSGYKILAVNYHSRYGEVDIIASDLQYICFVEVKARKTHAMTSGLAAVTPAKRRKIIKTALIYLGGTDCRLQPRFDVISIEADGGRIIGFEHLKGAFDGGEYG
ncbi:MAG: YraN family protein [Oscillospiraceae bacterium]|nr:YraN family protein [Oscillospiraceae bacterium]